MKTRAEPIDFHAVAPEHREVDAKLQNWARYVTPGRQSWLQPMFRLYRSKVFQWETPIIRTPPNTLEGAQMEKIVCALPEKHRYAIRWCYVIRCSPATACRNLAVTHERLEGLVRSGRTMVKNSLLRS